MSDPIISHLHVHQELAAIVHSVADKVMDSIATNATWASSAYSVILPVILNALDNSNSLLLPNAPIVPFLGGISAFITGTHQLTDKTTHRPNETQIKGLINILGSFEISAITTASLLGTVSLGPPGAAAFIGVSFALSLDETAHAFKRYLNQRDWLEDTCAMLDKNEELRTELHNQIFTLQNKLDKSMIETRLLDQKINRLTELTATQETLVYDLNAKMQYVMIKKEHQDDMLDFVKNLKNDNTIKLRNGLSRNWVSQIDLERNSMDDTSVETAHQAIQEKCFDEVQGSTLNTITWGLAFTGGVLLCIPGLQIPAAGILAAAAVLYFSKPAILYGLKNTSTLFKQLQANDTSKSLFNPHVTLPAKSHMTESPSGPNNFHYSSEKISLIDDKRQAHVDHSINQFESLQKKLKERLKCMKNMNVALADADTHTLQHQSVIAFGHDCVP